MFKNIKNNPILLHQMRHARWPSLRTAGLISVGLTLIGTVVTLTIFVLSPDGSNEPVLLGSSIISWASFPLSILGPILIAVIAGVSTVQVINSQAFQMIRLSQLSERDIVTGYIAAAVYRLRGLWMVIVGLVLPDLVTRVHFGIISEISLVCIRSSASCLPSTPSEILLKQVGFALISSITSLALFISWLWLAATLSVWMAFRHCQTGKALAGSLIRMAFTFVIQILIQMTTSWFIILLAYGNVLALLVWPLIITDLVTSIIFVVWGRGNFNRAVRLIEDVPG